MANYGFGTRQVAPQFGVVSQQPGMVTNPKVLKDSDDIAQIHKKCSTSCSWCANIDGCSFELRVDAPEGQNIAHIKERIFCCFPQFQVLDGQEKEIFKVGGPCCCFCQCVCCTDELVFPVYNNCEQVAKITKIWEGIARSCCINANTFEIHFLRRNLEVNKKLAILGCLFWVDYLFFENAKQLCR